MDESDNQTALSDQGTEHPFQQFNFEVREVECEVSFEGGKVSFRRQISIDQIDLLFGQGFRLLLIAE